MTASGGREARATGSGGDSAKHAKNAPSTTVVVRARRARIRLRAARDFEREYLQVVSVPLHNGRGDHTGDVFRVRAEPPPCAGKYLPGHRGIEAAGQGLEP